MTGITKLVLDAGVKEATLMEDRARVIRRGTVGLKAGVTAISVQGVSPLISDKTLVGRVISEHVVELVTVSVVREHRELTELAENDPERIRKNLNSIARKIQALGELRDQSKQKLVMLNELEEKALAEMAYDTSWSSADPESWKNDLANIGEKVNKVHVLLGSLARDVENLKAEQSEFERQLAAASSVTGEYIYRIEAIVNSAESGECTLEFEYLVPSACWRPSHVATLKSGMLELRAEGCVWQSTGEDWCGVLLWFSTQRPSLGLEPPHLGEDLLKVQRKPEQIVVEVREQEIEDAGLGQADGYRSTGDQDMPGIDDGGEIINLRSTSTADIPSNGRPYHVEINTFNTQAEGALVCMPELTRAVIFKSTQVNNSKSPLLAGPVNLIRNSGKVGNTVISYMAPGEAFDLGWGPDPELRVKRWQVDGKMDSKALSTWEEIRKTTHIRLSNIGNETKIITLRERIPVSEIDAVEIRYDRAGTTEKIEPDDNGFLEWQVKIEPFGRAHYEFAYLFRKKKAVSVV